MNFKSGYPVSSASMVIDPHPPYPLGSMTLSHCAALAGEGELYILSDYSMIVSVTPLSLRERGSRGEGVFQEYGGIFGSYFT